MRDCENLTLQLRPEQFGIYAPIGNAILENIGPKHLDFGCGTGVLPDLIGNFTNAEIYGYDPNENSICKAKRRDIRSRVTFTTSLEQLDPQSFDSANMAFVYHEAGAEVLKEARGLLKPEGKLIVIDYNLQGLGLNDFINQFNMEYEKKEIDEMGLLEAWKIHTNKGMSDLQQEAGSIGFNTIKAEALTNKFFIWIGQKV